MKKKIEEGKKMILVVECVQVQVQVQGARSFSFLIFTTEV